MLRKYENFINRKEQNIFTLDKAKNDNSFNKYNLNQNRNKIKSKNKEKTKNNVFKTINILHNHKKYKKDIKEQNFLKNHKNEKIARLNLCCVLLNNIKIVNTNDIKRYEKSLNNKANNYNYGNNNSSNEDFSKEKGNNSKKNSCRWTKKNNNKNKKKNLSHINITNLINNNYQINNSSLTKTKSTENINITKNIYNKSSDSEKNIKKCLNKKIFENNYNLCSNTRNPMNKKVSIFNNYIKRKGINKAINTNYNLYKSNSKSSNRKNRWTNSPGYRNIYKNKENVISSKKMKKNCKTPLSHKRLFNDIFPKFMNNKKTHFNIYLFDNLYNKAKNVLEICKNTLEMQIKNKV